MIIFDESICGKLEASLSREWLETNGIGGFASGTISGANSRRYHGWLTAAMHPPLGRMTMLAKCEETLVVVDTRYELSTDVFPGSVSPDGYKFLTSFRLDPFPVWTYNAGGVELERSIFMVHGENATVCRWMVIGGETDVSLEIRPLVACVDYHSLRKENDIDPEHTAVPGVIEYLAYPNDPPMYFVHNAVSVADSGVWYRNFEYPIERERGFDHHEDLFQPFVMTFDLAKAADLVVSVNRKIWPDADRLAAAERTRRDALISTAGVSDQFAECLVIAADQFIVKRGSGHTVIAGYPWFSDWGRDTMIALPGLTLATGRPEIARDIILEFSKSISEGMLPNRFPDAGEIPEYNTVDATLWYFEAIRAYAEKTGDTALVEEIYPKLADILAWHLHGTRYNIHVDTDGLLYAGAPDVQLTWMDAKIGDLVVTPRTGKPVEIQALWYNALRIMAEFANSFGHFEDMQRFDEMADLAKLSFSSAFWNADDECLYDVVENDHRDASIRPNQIFAVSLKNTMLGIERSAKIVEKVRSELLTPVGLRSLSPNDPDYVGKYIGSPFIRDSSYHQGTVWGWLLGPYIEACRRIGVESLDVMGELSGFAAHLLEAGVGQISEIFDGDAPHLPRGCPAQAWSVAEALRVLTDYSDRGELPAAAEASQQ